MEVLHTIMNDLRQLKPELSKRFYVDTIGLFGSVTRSDFNEHSDIDVMVDFKIPVGVEFIELADYLEAKLKRRVDLISRKGVKDNFFEAIKNEIMYV